MLKFGTFVSSIPDPNASECSSSSSHTEGTPKGLSRSARKPIANTPLKTKTPNLKKNLKPLGSGQSVSGKKQIFQNPIPRLKIDLLSTNHEKNVIPLISKGKGLLGPGLLT